MKPPYFHYELIHQSTRSRARVGRVHTPHGIIDTPNFVAVGTNGTLKALDNAVVDTLGLQLMFCNTYHLLLQPGPEVVAKAGGLHQFIGRRQPIITDSGGFQVFSLAYGGVADEIKSRGTKKHEGAVSKITERGVIFRSYRDGRKILLTPESTVEVQKDLGADIIIPLDELPPYHIDDKALRASLARTHRWEARSLETHLANPKQQAMYAVIHGGTDPKLRARSCEVLTELPFDGFAIGGSMGRTRDEMIETVRVTTPNLPEDKPNHLLGIGDLYSIDRCVVHGIDTFDSAYPTRAARHGTLFTSHGPIKIKSGRWAECFEPIEKDCPCPTCEVHSLAFLHHLFKASEPSAAMLASYHNVAYMVKHMRQLREAILENKI
ncbi:MAG: tRNA-guanosine(34) transglycosylase [Legionellales bacterium]|nr:tRNA-guanosine(34) transglycosylase [Legionellales bacterium]